MCPKTTSGTLIPSCFTAAIASSKSSTKFATSQLHLDTGVGLSYSKTTVNMMSRWFFCK
jgi:hypothetical protein